jgi:hypothetical protein
LFLQGHVTIWLNILGQWNGARYVHAIQSNSRSRIQETRNKRVSLYDKEWKRQQALISRLEKIEVSYEGQPENAILIMNKGVSTPFNCAQRKYLFLGDC